MKKTRMIALKSVRTLAATIEVERERLERSGGGPSRRRRRSASVRVSPVCRLLSLASRTR